MRARVVVVNWRQPDLTLRAARSLSSQLREGDRIVLVDNGSEDDSVIRLREGGFEVIALPENRGFGTGVNAGARGMTEDALVLLNNDAIAEEGFLDAILAPFEEHDGADIGATTARVLLSGAWARTTCGDAEALVGRDGSRWKRVSDGGITLVNSTGNMVDRSGNGYDRDWLEPEESVDSPPEVFGFCGGACAIRRTAWEQVGPFREDLFMYYEDTDLSWRLREAGWDIHYVADAQTRHDHAASSGTTSPMFITMNARNRILVAARHGPLPMLFRALLRTVVRAVRGPDRAPVAKALREALMGLPRDLLMRRRPRRVE